MKMKSLRRPPAEAADKARRQSSDAMGKARGQSAAVIDKARSQSADVIDIARRQSSEAADTARRRSADVIESARRQSADVIDTARRQSADVMDTARRQSTDVLDKALGRLPSRRRQRRKRAFVAAGLLAGLGIAAVLLIRFLRRQPERYAAPAASSPTRTPGMDTALDRTRPSASSDADRELPPIDKMVDDLTPGPAQDAFAGHISDMIGQHVVDAAGHSLGEVEAVYYRKTRGEPEWVALQVGDKRVLAPVHDATPGEELMLAYPKALVESCPSIDGDALDEGLERALYDHYNVRRIISGVEDREPWEQQQLRAWVRA